MAAWLEAEPSPVPEEILALVGGNPILGQVVLRRGLTTVEALRGFLDPAIYQPASPFDLPDMVRAVDRLLKAIHARETICVWGDFDVDGQTATALLVSTLRTLDARVIFHIPVRANESHGVNWGVLGQILAGDPQAAHGWKETFGPVTLLITCDTGISEHAAVETAQARGVDVIITDHHELPATLPSVYAIINPKLLPASHPIRALPGVGVAYKVAEALFQKAGHAQEIDNNLDLVALGIVADVALQVGDTRYLLQRGLQALRCTTRPGILAILEQAEIDPLQMNEEIIAYELAPRMNAIGRLGDANPAVTLLTTADIGEARLLANQIEIMNNQRRLLTSQVFQGALAQINQDPRLSGGAAIVLAHSDWPAGILGIVASRLVERFHKPVVLIAAPQGAPSRASVRSIAGINITQALNANADLLLNFGGHAMAAGFSIDPQRIDEFRQAFKRTIQRLGPLPEMRLEIDAFIELSELTFDLVQDFERLAPFGAGNQPLVLAAANLNITNLSPVGKGGEHISIMIEDQSGNSQPVIFWQGAGWPLPDDRFDLAFSARPISYRGKPGLQVEWLDFRPAKSTGLENIAKVRSILVDHRLEEFPLAVVQKLAKDTNLQVWGEAEAITILNAHGISAASRADLTPGLSLAVWTSPPAPDVLAVVLERIRPEQVFLFAVNPEFDRLEGVLRRLAGLVKQIIEKQNGQINLEKLAGGLAQTELVARRGLEWLAARGDITINEISPKEFQLKRGGIVTPKMTKQLASELGDLLAETRSYRATFRRSPLNYLGENID